MGRSDHTSYLYAAMTNVRKVTPMKKDAIAGIYIHMHSGHSSGILRAIPAMFKSSSKFPN